MELKLKTYNDFLDYKDYVFTVSSPIRFAYELATVFTLILVRRDYTDDMLTDDAFAHILLCALDYAYKYDANGRIQKILNDILLRAHNERIAYLLQSYNMRKQIGKVIQLLMRKCIQDLSNKDKSLHKK